MSTTPSTTSKPRSRSCMTRLSLLPFMLLLFTLTAWCCLFAWFFWLNIRYGTRDNVYTIQDIVSTDLNSLSTEKMRWISQALLSCQESIKPITSIFMQFPENENFSLPFFRINLTALTADSLPWIDRIFTTLSGVSQIIFIRGMVFLFTTPLFLLFIFIGVVDGLVARDIRKFQGARESTYLFHQGKKLFIPFFYLIFFFYLVMPFKIKPFCFLLPMSMGLGGIAWWNACTFKKYL